MNNLAYDLIVKHIVDDRHHPYVWFVKLFASKPMPANQNEREPSMREFNGNLYPDTTSHRLHLKGQEQAEAYVIEKRHNRVHEIGRKALIVSLLIFAAFQIVRVL